jgi:decaprenylphospho-beta-D-ribofuranose 2-oxidase
MNREISGWGRYPRIAAEVCCFDDLQTARAFMHGGGPRIAFGMGRSYGDSALAPRVICTRRHNSILAFDANTGIVTCESGVLLGEIIDAFLPRGWFLAVTPGTQFVTVGGAIASDVHGKNHHQSGCFSQSLISLQVLLPDGQVVVCSPHENRGLFLATCGGMGLTGLILTASFRLHPVGSALIQQKVVKARNVQEVVHGFEEYSHWNYSVAWIDCLTTGVSTGRSLLLLGEHASVGPLRVPLRKQHSLAVELPSFILSQHAVRAFNYLYYHRVNEKGHDSQMPLRKFFYPLDAIDHWNRMYGKQGFTQYQLVLPLEASLAGLTQLLSRIASSGLGSFLAVLKLLGPENDNYLSFPLSGYTLALDFKVERKLWPLLNELDRIVLDHGGRIYLSKDARMAAEVFRVGYPRWEKFKELREQLGLTSTLASLQSNRLEI